MYIADVVQLLLERIKLKISTTTLDFHQFLLIWPSFEENITLLKALDFDLTFAFSWIVNTKMQYLTKITKFFGQPVKFSEQLNHQVYQIQPPSVSVFDSSYFDFSCVTVFVK